MLGCIDKNSALPVYMQLENILRSMIESGELKKDDSLPCERILASDYAISRMTARKALSGLVEEGLVYRIQGRGSFVRGIKNREAAGTLMGALLSFADRELSASLLEGMEAVAGERGFSLIAANDGRDFQRQLERVRSFIRQGVRGVILAPVPSDSEYDRNLSALDELKRHNVPVVLLDRYLDDLELDYVVSDNFEGARKLTRHLIDCGHRRIAFIREAFSSAVRDRLRGWKTALEEAGLDYDENLVAGGEDMLGEESGYVCAKRLLARDAETRPTAFFAVHDITAKGILRACSESSLSVPGDIAVAGYDDSPLAAALGITSVSQPLAEMGRCAFELLMDRLRDRRATIRSLVLKSELVIRASTCNGFAKT